MPNLLPQDLVGAYQTLLAKCKLTLIQLSKTIQDAPIAVEDIVQVFVKSDHEKRGKWSDNRTILAYDFKNRTITLPWSKGRTTSAVVEDVRPAIRDDEIASTLQDAIFELDRHLEEAVDRLYKDTTVQKVEQNMDSHHQESEEVELYSNGPNLRSLGDKIEVHWPNDKQFYERTVQNHDEGSSKYSVLYEDGDNENLDLREKVWNYVKNTDSNDHQSTSDSTATNDKNIVAREGQLSPGEELQSEKMELIDIYYKAIGNEEFVLQHAQGLPPYATQNAYEREANSFKKTVMDVAVADVPEMPTSSLFTSCARSKHAMITPIC